VKNIDSKIQKRGKAMPQEASEIINPGNFLRIPSHWESPKYSLGQMVEQGQIIGIEYQPPGTLRAYELGVGWNYTVLLDDQGLDVENIRESSIRQLTVSGLQSEIERQKLIVKIHQKKLSILDEQLAEVQE
jgi:hypothetical protein